MPREKVTYAQTYKKPGAKLHQDSLPKLKHTNGAKVVNCFLQEAGCVTTAEGEELEYQILKVYLKVKK